MAAKGLTESWRAAEAAKPSAWRIMGVVTGPRVADPAIEGEDWCAWARGPKDERVDGYGPSPQDALSSTRACLFCGRTGVKLTREHVYPQWIGDALNIRGGISFSVHGTLLRSASELDVQLREVCSDCNNKWLHDLEAAFRSVMTLPLNGFEPVVMPEPVQLVVSLWATKTWLLIEDGRTARSVYVVLQDGRPLSPRARVSLSAAELAVMVRDHALAGVEAGQPADAQDRRYGGHFVLRSM